MDKALVATIAKAGDGRLSFEPARERLVHVRVTGGVTPVYATSAQIRSVMAVLVLTEGEPPEHLCSLEYGVHLLLALLDLHPVRALLGWERLCSVAGVPSILSTGDQIWDGPVTLAV